MVGIHHPSHTVVTERVAVAAAVRRPAHRLDVTAVEAAVAKGLRELRTADARQPTAHVVAVNLLAGIVVVETLPCHPSVLVIRVFRQYDFRAAQLVLDG